MRQWREEKGSALVMVMFMMLILTLLGVTILSATVAGARRTLTRENDIQSLQLTQKVLDESVALISAKLNERVAQPGFDATRLKAAIDTVVNELPVSSEGILETGKGGVQTNALTAASGSLIAKPIVEPDIPDLPSDPKNLRAGTAYTVTLKAAGIVNGVKRTLTQEVKINMYPDFLQYAFGSEQDLILNGAPYIDGNIYAGNNLIVTNRPEYKYKGKSLDTTSLYPNMKKNSLVFIQGLDHFLSGDHKDRTTPITSNGDAQVDNRVKQALGSEVGIPQLQIKDQQKFIQINVEQSFIEKLATSTGVSQTRLQGIYNENTGSPTSKMSAVVAEIISNNPSFKQLSMPKPAEQKPYPSLSIPATSAELNELNNVIRYNNEEIERYTKELFTLNTSLNNMATTSIFTGNLEVGGKTISSLGTQSKDAWLIVNGDLIFSGDELPLTSVASNVLVTGNVRFKNQVQVDSTMIVMGSTTIEDASIQGIEVEGEEKEIVLISKGSVLLNRVDAFVPNVQKLQGFFYTDSTATLYGVGSNFSLEGGFFAKGNLTINAVVGDSKEQGTDNILFEPQMPDGTQSTTSRFKVKYNDDVYANQGKWLPQVEQVSISVGKLEIE